MTKIPVWFRWTAAVLIVCASLLGDDTKAAKKNDAKKVAPPAAKLDNLVWPLPPDLPRIRWVTEYSDLSKVESRVRKTAWIDKVTGAQAPTEKLSLRAPYGVTTDDRGRIYAADTQQKAVFVIDAEAKTVEQRHGTSRVPLILPTGVAVDAEGRLFVSDAELHAVICFSPAGEIVMGFGAAALGRPGGIAIDRQRNLLYVADVKESRIAVFDTKSFKLVRHLGGPGKPGQKDAFAGPTNVALDRQGTIYVADTLNSRVQILSPDGKFVRAFGTQGDRPGQFIRPKGIAVDSEGHVYVADAEFNNIQILTAEGQPLLAVGTLGTRPGEFALIASLYIDAKDQLYTTEMMQGRIQVFRYISQPAQAPRQGGE